MAELDVFVGNYVIIDWELYSLWLSGRSVAEAITVFVRENRGMISDHHVSQDIIVSDFEDNWRLFSMLENCFLVSASSAEIGSATSTAPLQLLDASTRKKSHRVLSLLGLGILPRNPRPQIKFQTP